MQRLKNKDFVKCRAGHYRPVREQFYFIVIDCQYVLLVKRHDVTFFQFEEGKGLEQSV